MRAYAIACTLCQVFNTGLLLVIANVANSDLYLKGRYRDFEPLWYADVGPQLFQTYVLIAIWPIIEISYTWLFAKLGVLYDQGSFCCFGRDQNKTRSITVQQFI